MAAGFQRPSALPRRHALATAQQDCQPPACPCPWKHGKAIEDASTCPLGCDHPPNGEEFALGCGICRDESTF